MSADLRPAGRARPDLPAPATATLPIMLAAQPWDWWIALVLFVAGALAILAFVVGYLYKVVMPQYPRRGQRVQADSQQKT
jgi:membrane protein implicated in regulation of membrane protease activity